MDRCKKACTSASWLLLEAANNALLKYCKVRILVTIFLLPITWILLSFTFYWSLLNYLASVKRFRTTNKLPIQYTLQRLSFLANSKKLIMLTSRAALVWILLVPQGKARTLASPFRSDKRTCIYDEYFHFITYLTQFCKSFVKWTRCPRWPKKMTKSNTS